MATESAITLLIPTFQRAGKLTTLSALPLPDYHIACHTDDERDALLRAQTELDPERVHVSNVPSGALGAPNQFAWLCERFGVVDAWTILADDNVRMITGIAPEHRSLRRVPVHETSRTSALRYGGTTWYKVFRYIYTVTEFLRALNEDICEAVANDLRLIGFSTLPAWLYRGKHYRYHGFACGKLLCYKLEGDAPWHEYCHMWDMHISAEQHVRYGGLLVDEWLHPNAPDFAPGGFGPYAQRVPWLEASIRTLMSTYPGLFKLAPPRADIAYGTSIEFALTSPHQIQSWRERLLATHA